MAPETVAFIAAILATVGPIVVGLIDWWRWRKTPKVQDSEAEGNISEAYQKLNQRFEALAARYEEESENLREQVNLLEAKVKVLASEKEVLGIELMRQKNEYETRLIELSKRLQSEIILRVELQRKTNEQSQQIEALEAKIAELQQNGRPPTS